MFNPVAGRRRASLLWRVLDVLVANGVRLDLAETHRPGHAEALAREAVDKGERMVVAAGGDGTIAEIANGLMGSPVRLGIIPLGTANVLAHELGLPFAPHAVAAALAFGRTRLLWPGLAQGGQVGTNARIASAAHGARPAGGASVRGYAAEAEPHRGGPIVERSAQVKSGEAASGQAVSGRADSSHAGSDYADSGHASSGHVASDHADSGPATSDHELSRSRALCAAVPGEGRHHRSERWSLGQELQSAAGQIEAGPLKQCRGEGVIETAPDQGGDDLAGGAPPMAAVAACDAPRRRLFVQMLGVGFDARVVHTLPAGLKRAFGKGAYVLQTMNTLFRYDFSPIHVRIDGQETSAASVIVSKGVLYGGTYRLAPDARPGEPGFSVVLFDHAGPGWALLYGAALPANLLAGAPGVRQMRAEQVDFIGNQVAPAQADGDAAGFAPLSIVNAPAPIQVVTG